MSDFIAFRRMLTPILIQIVYWLATVGVVIGGLVALAVGEDAAERLAGVAILILGPFVVRLFCEILMVVFRMNETLSEIRRNTQHS